MHSDRLLNTVNRPTKLNIPRIAHLSAPFLLRMLAALCFHQATLSDAITTPPDHESVSSASFLYIIIEVALNSVFLC